jgi:hypothetical protein
MTEYNCFEIWDKNGNLIGLFVPEEELTEKQMTKLMKIFNGVDNSESWYNIEPID